MNGTVEQIETVIIGEPPPSLSRLLVWSEADEGTQNVSWRGK